MLISADAVQSQEDGDSFLKRIIWKNNLRAAFSFALNTAIAWLAETSHISLLSLLQGRK